MPTAPSTQLFPEVVDASTLVGKPAASIFLPIGAEGQADNDGSATAGSLYVVNTISEAATIFGAASLLTKLLTAVINQGAYPIVAGASKKGSLPSLSERQTVWDDLSSDSRVRLRLTDSVVQADLVALATSCVDAELLQYKQLAFGGLTTGATKAAQITAAGAIGSSRLCLVAPGVYDADGTLQTGSYASAVVAAEVAKNADLSNDLDLLELGLLAGIEKTASGLPVYRMKVAGGVKTNDFEDLLQGGVSPLMPSRIAATGVQISHLRTTYTATTAFDAISTRLIVDQVFVDVRDYIFAAGFLRRGNTEANRNALKAAVTALLFERIAWISPVTQADNTQGFNVSVTPSADMRQVTVSYEGRVVRGIQTIQVAARLTVPT